MNSIPYYDKKIACDGTSYTIGRGFIPPLPTIFLSIKNELWYSIDHE